MSILLLIRVSLSREFSDLSAQIKWLSQIFLMFTLNDEHASEPVKRENHSSLKSLSKSENVLLQTDIAFLFCVTQKKIFWTKKNKFIQ